MKVGIIIPCYNEEKRLKTHSFRSALYNYSDIKLCFVNDGSTDNTIGVLKTLTLEFPSRVTILNKRKNQGKAAAIRDGARFFYNQPEIKYVGYLDADLSTDFKDFDSLVNSLKQDRKLIMVFGSRNQGNTNIKRNFFRKMFSVVIMKLIQFILKLPIKDTQCGAKVFRKKYTPVMYNSIFKTKWLFDVEMFFRLKKHFSNKNLMNYIEEKPLKNWVHEDNSKLTIKDSFQIPFNLLHLWYTYSY